ncbi:hypothetical protein HNR46_002812 [Haloferula luteola]|uniref:Uncharacterized protein n=1 Tax=Haloferula luteola TaxID=595692 RepID=A0A840V6B2_9BACT|nr:hypothetical protein [Haloferula luteola]MBB5352566.1 hypothetical protein [Haloferula luteola]
MRETLVVVGLVVLAIGLRSSRTGVVRKLGALVFLAASYVLVVFLTGRWWLGILGVVPWFLLPWIELLTRIRCLRLPVNNALNHRRHPDPAFFPHAPEAAASMEEAGFEHVADCSWEWGGMRQYLQLYWHPEERAEATIHLCEQSEVAFSFLSITSRHCDGRTFRTTNFPFSPTLKSPQGVRWNHVPCERNAFEQILADHRQYLTRLRIDLGTLRMPDPDEIEGSIEEEMRTQLQHNLEEGILRASFDDRYFEYSTRGLFFLWGQFVKDMIRLC